MTESNSAWSEGVIAFMGMKEKAANPYAKDTIKYVEWAKGWDDAAIISDPNNPMIGVNATNQ